MFRGPWPSRQAGTVLAHARDLVATLRDFRNRLFHHEPAWKRYGVLTEAESLLALIHPENLRLLPANGLLRDAHRACTAREIRRFQHLAQVHKVNSLGELAGLVDRSAQENSVLEARVFRGRMQRFLILPQ